MYDNRSVIVRDPSPNLEMQLESKKYIIQILDGLQMDDGPFNFEMLPPLSQVSSIPSSIASAFTVELLLSKGVELEQPSKNL